MNLEFSPEEIAFRDEIRTFIEENYPEEMRGISATREDLTRDQFLAWHKVLGKKGWAAPAWPEEYGGTGWTSTQRYIWSEENARVDAVPPLPFGVSMVGPVNYTFGNEEQKQENLPKIISGEEKMCFAVTEPNSGLDTSSLETKAERTNSGYTINGRKIWTTGAQRADKILIIARTTPKDQCAKPYLGLSLFYTDLDRGKIEAIPIPKMGRKAVECNTLFIDGLEVPKEHLIGEEGAGFKYLIQGLNPERVLIAVESIGLGFAALEKANTYANERVVFGRPIGQNQGIAHPLAKAWAELSAAELLSYKAAALFDQGEECGAEANAAKYLGTEAGFNACETAVLTHGGMGYAREYHVERYMREAMLARIAPVSREMILNFIAERVLGLPKSY